MYSIGEAAKIAANITADTSKQVAMGAEAAIFGGSSAGGKISEQATGTHV